MVDWLAGKRIKGTSTERTASFIPSVGGWVELGRTTLGSTADTISVASLADKRYYMILADQRASGSTNHGFRLNGDVTSTYAQRGNFNGTENILAPASSLMGNWGSAVTTNAFHVGYLANKSDKEKLAIIHNVTQGTAGAGYAPSRQEGVGKHAQTSVAINAVSLTNTDAGDYISGSELVVLGWDPADTHATNFWTELASVQGTASSQILSSGTITAKKYLWIQGFTGGAGGGAGHNSAIQFNNDTATNYATRRSLDGGADDSSWINQAYAQVGTNSHCFFNYFIINNSANEKLCIGHIAQRSTVGAGYAPARGEFVCKWNNISAQITEIDLMQQTTSINWGTDVYMKVWGSN